MNLRLDESLKARPRILVVDDEVAMVRSLELLLRPLGEVVKAYSVLEAMEVLQSNIDCVVSDVNMPEESGLNLLERVRSLQPQTPVIIMTAYSSVPEAVDAMQRGAFEYLVKPFENQDLMDCVKRAIDRKGLLVGESACLPSGWVCNSDAMKSFIAKAEKMALHSAPVLVFGQTGSGKRRAARWMFERQERAGDFLCIDFQGPEEDHPLLKLDPSKWSAVYVAEVFSLNSKLQASLKDWLRHEDLKIFAGSSTSPSLQKPANFDSELYEALLAHVIHIPPLSEREADLEALCFQLIESIAKKMRLKNLSLDQSALNTIRHHTYLGNVKELELILERSAIETKTGVISSADLVFETPDLSRQLPFSIPVEEGWGRLEFLHASLEKDLIIRSIEKYPNLSNTQIASILGTTRRILELRMKTYQIRET